MPPTIITPSSEDNNSEAQNNPALENSGYQSTPITQPIAPLTAEQLASPPSTLDVVVTPAVSAVSPTNPDLSPPVSGLPMATQTPPPTDIAKPPDPVIFEMSNQPAAIPTGPVVSSVLPSQQTSGLNFGAPRKRKKTYLLIGAVVSLVLALGAGFVFAYYLPNRPQNVYKTGLNHSGRAITTLVSKATEQKALDSFKKTEINATADASFNGGSYSGTFNVKLDTTKADGNASFTAKETGSLDKVFTAKFKAALDSGAQYPNAYFQLSGFKSFGLDSYWPAVADFDGKWIAVEAAYLKSIGVPPTTAQQTAQKQFTTADFTELAKTTADVTSEYVLTANPTRAVFVNKKFVAKESVDGISAYHYQVGLNKDHLKNYCTVMVDRLLATNAYKKLPWVDTNNLEAEKTSMKTDCEDSTKDIKESDTFDMWVDAKYKLIYKFRITDPNNAEAYTDIGQHYSGTNEVSLFVNYHDGKSKNDASFNLTTNLTTYTTKVTFSMTEGSGSEAFNVKLSLEAKPFTGDIQVDKPADTLPIKDVLDKLGLDPRFLLGFYGNDLGTGVSAQDTERKTDISALAAHAEVYNATNGYYPTLANINSAAWRAVNMKGLDYEALKDPQGTTYTLVGQPATHVYAYVATTAGGGACDNAVAGHECAKYTLTATLATGGVFTKTELN